MIEVLTKRMIREEYRKHCSKSALTKEEKTALNNVVIKYLDSYNDEESKNINNNRESPSPFKKIMSPRKWRNVTGTSNFHLSPRKPESSVKRTESPVKKTVSPVKEISPQNKKETKLSSKMKLDQVVEAVLESGDETGDDVMESDSSSEAVESPVKSDNNGIKNLPTDSESENWEPFKDETVTSPVVRKQRNKKRKFSSSEEFEVEVKTKKRKKVNLSSDSGSEDENCDGKRQAKKNNINKKNNRNKTEKGGQAFTGRKKTKMQKVKNDNVKPVGSNLKGKKKSSKKEKRRSISLSSENEDVSSETEEKSLSKKINQKFVGSDTSGKKVSGVKLRQNQYSKAKLKSPKTNGVRKGSAYSVSDSSDTNDNLTLADYRKLDSSSQSEEGEITKQQSGNMDPGTDENVLDKQAHKKEKMNQIRKKLSSDAENSSDEQEMNNKSSRHPRTVKRKRRKIIESDTESSSSEVDFDNKCADMGKTTKVIDTDDHSGYNRNRRKNKSDVRNSSDEDKSSDQGENQLTNTSDEDFASPVKRKGIQTNNFKVSVPKIETEKVHSVESDDSEDECFTTSKKKSSRLQLDDSSSEGSDENENSPRRHEKKLKKMKETRKTLNASNEEDNKISKESEEEDAVPMKRKASKTKARNGKVSANKKDKKGSKMHPMQSNDSEDECSTTIKKNSKLKKTDSKPKERSAQYKNLVKMCRDLGVFIGSLADYTTEEERIDRLKELLHKRGMRGEPSFTQVKRLLLQKEAAELDQDSIIETSGRTKRRVRSIFARNSPSPKKQTTPVRQKFSKIQDIIDSEESD